MRTRRAKLKALTVNDDKVVISEYEAYLFELAFRDGTVGEKGIHPIGELNEVDRSTGEIGNRGEAVAFKAVLNVNNVDDHLLIITRAIGEAYLEGGRLL